jgi:hypothetical protein
VVPRTDPTSPANALGEAETSTLKTRVTSAPWPTPNAISPPIVGTVSQLLVVTNASQTSAVVQLPRGGDRANREDEVRRRQEECSALT